MFAPAQGGYTRHPEFSDWYSSEPCHLRLLSLVHLSNANSKYKQLPPHVGKKKRGRETRNFSLPPSSRRRHQGRGAAHRTAAPSPSLSVPLAGESTPAAPPPPRGGARGIPLYAMEYPRFYKQIQIQIHIYVYTGIFATCCKFDRLAQSPTKSSEQPTKQKMIASFPGCCSQLASYCISPQFRIGASQQLPTGQP